MGSGVVLPGLDLGDPCGAPGRGDASTTRPFRHPRIRRIDVCRQGGRDHHDSADRR